MEKALSIKGFKIHIEIPVFLYFFADLIAGSLFQNLIIYRTCYFTCGYNKSDCAYLGSDSKENYIQKLEELVQPHATYIIIAPTFIQSILSGIVCLFSGPWSDKFGRKPLLLLSVAGRMLGQASMILLIYLENVSPVYFLLPAFLESFSGGPYCFITAAFSYLSDVTSEAGRSFRMGLYQIIYTAAVCLGTASSSYIFHAVGYAAAHEICLALTCLALLFIFFFVPESTENQNRPQPFKSIFKLRHLYDMYKTTVAKRDNNGRLIIIFCLVILSLDSVVTLGNSGVQFLFLRDKFQFSLQEYTLFSSLNTVVGFLGCVIGVYFLSNYLKMTESILIFTGFILKANSILVLGLASDKWHVYFSLILAGYSSIILPMTCSLVSKIVQAEDLGKIFSLLNVMTVAFIGSLGLPIFTSIYNLTLTVDPGFINFVAAGFTSVNIILAGAVMYCQGLQHHYSSVESIISSKEI